MNKKRSAGAGLGRTLPRVPPDGRRQLWTAGRHGAYELLSTRTFMESMNAGGRLRFAFDQLRQMTKSYIQMPTRSNSISRNIRDHGRVLKQSNGPAPQMRGSCHASISQPSSRTIPANPAIGLWAAITLISCPRNARSARVVASISASNFKLS